jgi:hypothetical protein
MGTSCNEHEREEVYMKGFVSETRREKITKETRLLRLDNIIVNLKEIRRSCGMN